MNITYEMFLTIQMHLTCRKDCIHNRLQANKNEDLLRRTSDDSSRFVAWGFSRKEGIDYEETFTASGS